MAVLRCRSLPRELCYRHTFAALCNVRHPHLGRKGNQTTSMHMVQRNPARAFATTFRFKVLLSLSLCRHDSRSFSSSCPKSGQQQQFSLKEDAVNEDDGHSQTQQRGRSKEITIQKNSSILQPAVKSKPAQNTASFREMMRLVTHPVAIITSTDVKADEHGGPVSWRGATVSSFNSVTLDPEPYVSFNIKDLSSTYDAIRSSNLFAAHVLSETLQATEMATHFSRGNELGPFFVQTADGSGDKNLVLQPFVSRDSGGKAWADQEGDIAHGLFPPSLHWRSHSAPDAVLFRILCQYQPEKTTSVGDHVVVIGKVIHIVARDVTHSPSDEASFEPLANQKCLTYANGKYNLERAG